MTSSSGETPIIRPHAQIRIVQPSSKNDDEEEKDDNVDNGSAFLLEDRKAKEMFGGSNVRPRPKRPFKKKYRAALKTLIPYRPKPT